MASWTDNSQILGTFPGFTPAAPLEPLVTTGTYFQKEYEAGWQKIHDRAEAIYGLPVTRDVAKKYLNDKMSSIKGELSKNISGDFSDHRLTNQIGGYVSQVAKDPLIQNEVSSTLVMKKGQADKETARKEGKSAPENEWDFDNDVQKWVSGDLDQSFTSHYTPYTDLNKKWLDVVKALHEDEKLNDIPFETFINADGSMGVNYKKLSDVMIKRGVTGLQASKIENAIRATLSNEDYKQLSISARYRFKDVAPEQLAEIATKKYESRMEQLKTNLAEAEKYIATLKGSPDKFSHLQQVIEDYKKIIGGNGKKGEAEQQLEDEIDAIRANPDQAKVELYKNGFISQFSNAFSWKKDKTEYVDSPFTKVMQWNKDYAIKQSNNKLGWSKFSWDQQQDLIKNDLESRKLTLEMEKIYGKGSGMKTYLGADTDVPSPVDAMAGEAQDLAMQVSQGRESLKKRLNGISDADLDEKIAAYQNGDKTVFTSDVVATVDNIIKSNNTAQDIQSVIDKNRKEAEAEVYQNNPTAGQMLMNRHPLIITINGQEVAFSPKEVYTYLNKEHKESIQGGGTAVMGVGSNTSTSVNRELLSNKEKLLYKAMESRYKVGSYSTGNKQLDKYVQDFEDVSKQTVVNERAVNTSLNKRLLPIAKSWVPQVEEIQTPTSESRNSLEAKANTVLTRMQSDGGDNAESNMGALTSWLADKKQKENLTYMHFSQGEKQQLWVKNGSEVAKLDLTPGEAYQLPGTGKVSPEILADQKALDLGGGTTNITGLPEKGKYRQTEFKNVKKLTVTGDFNRELNGEGIFVNINIKTPSGWKNIQFDTPLDIGGAKGYIRNATDSDIITDAIEALNKTGDKKTIAELKNLLK